MIRTPKTLTVAALALVAALFSGLPAFGANPMDPATTNVSFAGREGVTLRGYLATPTGSGRHPAVLMIHEWWGLNQDTADLADALAREGYVVLAADAFRGSVAMTPADALAQVRGTPAQRIAADLDAALDYLRSHPRVDAANVASLGFCFGGTQSMFMGTRRPELAGVVIFYGGGPIQSADQLGSMAQAGPVLGIYGEEDGGIPVEQVRTFEKALEARGVEKTITIYPGVGHAFVKSDTYNAGGAPQAAWQQMLGFLGTTLKD